MSTVKLTMEWHPNTDVPERDKCNSDWDILVVDKDCPLCSVMGAWYTPEGEFMSFHTYDYDNYRLEDIVAWAYLPEGAAIKDLFEGLKGV